MRANTSDEINPCAAAAAVVASAASVRAATVLRKLGCIVCSKIKGIGTAERDWKQIKAVKNDQKAVLGEYLGLLI